MFDSSGPFLGSTAPFLDSRADSFEQVDNRSSLGATSCNSTENQHQMCHPDALYPKTIIVSQFKSSQSILLSEKTRITYNVQFNFGEIANELFVVQFEVRPIRVARNVSDETM